MKETNDLYERIKKIKLKIKKDYLIDQSKYDFDKILFKVGDYRIIIVPDKFVENKQISGDIVFIDNQTILLKDEGYSLLFKAICQNKKVNNLVLNQILAFHKKYQEKNIKSIKTLNEKKRLYLRLINFDVKNSFLTKMGINKEMDFMNPANEVFIFASINGHIIQDRYKSQNRIVKSGQKIRICDDSAFVYHTDDGMVIDILGEGYYDKKFYYPWIRYKFIKYNKKKHQYFDKVVMGDKFYVKKFMFNKQDLQKTAKRIKYEKLKDKIYWLMSEDTLIDRKVKYHLVDEEGNKYKISHPDLHAFIITKR